MTINSNHIPVSQVGAGHWQVTLGRILSNNVLSASTSTALLLQGRQIANLAVKTR